MTPNEIDVGALIQRIEAAEEFMRTEMAQLWKALLRLQDELKQLKRGKK